MDVITCVACNIYQKQKLLFSEELVANCPN